MPLTPEPTDLTGKLLIAMPGMEDPRFETSVIYLCAHSDEGAMGLMINRRLEDMVLDDLLAQLSITPGPASAGQPVHIGGPVEHGRGFVLHSVDYMPADGGLQVDDHFAMSVSREVLGEIAAGAGPKRHLIALGYAGWGAGQLEDEIRANGWLTCDAQADLIFDLPNDRKWAAALASLGISPQTLSSSAGHA